MPFINEISIGAALVAGLIAGLSPCTLPTAALIVGYVGGSRQTSRSRCFFITLSFVLGLSITLAILGIAASSFGGLIKNLSYVYKLLGGLMVLLGLVVLGIVPLRFQSNHYFIPFKESRGSLTGAFLLGIPFALIASPCTLPITTFVLALAATKGDVFFGFWFLLVYAMGRSAPLLLIGTFTGILKSLLKSKGTLLRLQQVSGIILIGLGIYFVLFAI